MILNLPKLLCRRDRPQVFSPFSDVSNMPLDIKRRTSTPSFDAMAADLDNSTLPLFCGSSTLRGSVQKSVTSWAAEVSGGSLEFSKFSFPSPSKIKWRPVEDFDACTLFSEGDSGSLPKATHLFSLNEVYMRSYIPPLVIGIHDIVGEKQLVPQKDGFMYYDPSVAPLQHVISSRGLPSSSEDRLLDPAICLKNHAVRVFQEVPPVASIVNGPYFRYIGDYYVLRTQKTLSKTAWAKLSEDVKNVVVRRFLETAVAPANDPIPGHRYSVKNVREWYDNGNVLPLVVLRQTFRPPTLGKGTSKSSSLSSLGIDERSEHSPAPGSTFGSCVSSPDIDHLSESVYSQESAHDDDDDDSQSLLSRASACDTHAIASGAFLPAERQEGTSTNVQPSIYVSTRENHSCEDVGRGDAIVQILEVGADDGTSCLMVPFLLQTNGDER